MTELSAELSFQLIEEQSGPGLRASGSHVSVGAGQVLFAIDERGRHLLVPVALDADVPEDRSSRGVQIRSRSIGPTEGGAKSYIDVACMQPELSTVFATFVDDLLSELGHHPDRPDQVVPFVLRRWRELLRPGARHGLSEEKLVGLLGELQLLHELGRYDAVGALDCWHGWAGEGWDFRGGPAALEVKATTRPEGRGFWVHGADQLDTAGGTDLVVHFRRYVRDDSAGTGVADVLADLASVGVNDSAVRSRLAQVGWSPAADEPEPRYTLVESFSWRVGHDFPRIVPGSFVGGEVPRRVEALRYWVDLEKPPPLPMLDGELEAHLETLLADVVDPPL